MKHKKHKPSNKKQIGLSKLKISDIKKKESYRLGVINSATIILQRTCVPNTKEILHIIINKHGIKMHKGMV